MMIKTTANEALYFGSHNEILYKENIVFSDHQANINSVLLLLLRPP